MKSHIARTWRTLALVALLVGLPTGFFGCGGGGDLAGPGAQPGGVPAGGGDLLPRDLLAKPATTIVTNAQNPSKLFVKFMDDTGVQLQGGWPTVPEALLDDALANALAYVEGGTWHTAHPVGDAVLDEVRDTAQRNAGQEMADFTVMFILDLPTGAEPGYACDAFNASAAVELAWPMAMPQPVPLPPDYESMQDYLEDATNGIGAQRMWNSCANRGAGVQIADIEYSWNLSHVDLPTVTLLGPAPIDPFADNNHGTAVLGEMASLDNGWGTTGACPDATFYVVAANTALGYNVAGAITTALGTLGPGDIILLEQQTTGPAPNAGFVPIEWNLSVRLAIQTAVANGVTVVEAAGNGNQDLDDAKFGGYFGIDSGAIIVGGGAPPGHPDGDRSRLTYSTYGSTVDLQGHGDWVMTTGYGTYYSAEGVNLWYRSNFAGTSSASPIVTAACALLQSTTIARTGTPLTPGNVRNQLIANGSPQLGGTNPVTEHIGPRPDVPGTIGCITIYCPPDMTYECANPAGTTVVDSFGVSDAAGGALTWVIRVNGTQEATGTFPASPPTSGGTITFSHTYGCCSTHTVEVEVQNVLGAIETCSYDVTVQDTLPPVAQCPGTITVECTSPSGAVVDFTGANAATAIDVCDPSPTITYAPASGSTFPIGTTTVTATATDAAGLTHACQFNVVVQDTTAPFVSATARRLMLFLPRNGLIDCVLQYSASDTCDASLANTVAVYSNQADTGVPFTPDATWTGSALEIRAEVDLTLPDPGRVFLIVVDSTDDAGNTGRSCTWVIVPKTATAQDVVGARNIAVTADSNCEGGGALPPAGWVQVLAPTAIP